jgi:hypothetical protein
MNSKGEREGLKGIVCKGWNKRDQPWQREVVMLVHLIRVLQKLWRREKKRRCRAFSRDHEEFELDRDLLSLIYIHVRQCS